MKCIQYVSTGHLIKLIIANKSNTIGSLSGRRNKVDGFLYL